MRITNSSMIDSYLHDLQGNLQSVDKLHKQATTGNQISRLSDDPNRAVRIMKMQNEISDVERYNYNIDEVSGWTESTDGCLDSLGKAVSDIKELLVKVGNGTYSEDEINSVGLEVNQKIAEIGEILNTTHGGDSLFGGSTTGSKPIEIKTDSDGKVKLSLSTTANDKKLYVEVSHGMSIEYNEKAVDIVNGALGNDLSGNPRNYFSVLNEIGEAFKSGTKDDIKKLTGDLQKDVDSFLKHTLNARTELGAKENIMESIRRNNDDSIITMKGALSLTKNVDVAEKYIEYKSAEMVYTAAVQLGAKMIVPTILDYLR